MKILEFLAFRLNPFRLTSLHRFHKIRDGNRTTESDKRMNMIGGSVND